MSNAERVKQPHARRGLYVSRVGTGPDVVLLHGWGLHSGAWEDVVEQLADHYRITVMDLPGHGYSRLPEAGHTLRDLGRAVAAAAPPKAHWVGWSLGGLVAQRVAIDSSERVASLVMVASSPSFVARPDWPHGMSFDVLHQFAENLGDHYRATLLRFLALEVKGSENARDQLRLLREIVFQHGEPDATALADGLAILEGEDLRAELGAIACPVLLLLGRRDNLVPASAGPATQQLLANARLHIFERGGHAPFFSHLPEFAERLQEFFDAR